MSTPLVLPAPSPDAETQDTVTQANTRLRWGLGIGVFSAVSYTLLGAMCPLCLVATPALIGSGLWGRAKAKRTQPGKG